MEYEKLVVGRTIRIIYSPLSGPRHPRTGDFVVVGKNNTHGDHPNKFGKQCFTTGSGSSYCGLKWEYVKKLIILEDKSD